MTVNQSTDYITPATFSIYAGLHYARYRTINASDKLVFTLVANSDTGVEELVPMNLVESFNAVGWSAQSEPPGAIPTPLYSSDKWFLEVTDGNAHL